MTFKSTSSILLWCVFLNSLIAVVSSTEDPIIVSRSEWGAKPPKSIEIMTNPVPYVVIHHSYIPPACNTSEDCIKAMHWIQDFHQINNGWVDVGYHFVVGGDGKAYEGRGWSRVGAHAPHYNNISIGICIIGDWRETLPPEQQLLAVHQLIQMGVREGKIVEHYKLVGHKQVRDGTVCPGDALFNAIQTWPHFYNVPYPPEPRVALKEKIVKIVPPEEDNRLKKRAPSIS